MRFYYIATITLIFQVLFLHLPAIPFLTVTVLSLIWFLRYAAVLFATTHMSPEWGPRNLGSHTRPHQYSLA